MKRLKIVIFISCLIFIVVGFPAAAESQPVGHRPSEYSPQKHSWNHDRRYSADERTGFLRVSNEPGHRSPGTRSRKDDEDRRSSQPKDHASPKYQEHRERVPNHRHSPRGHKPQHREPRRPDKHHDKRNDKHRPDYRGEQRPQKHRDDYHHDQHRDHRSDHRYDQRRDHQSHRRPPYSPPRHDHRHNHRPKYRVYKHHKYIYYRSPWYNTWFLAPILWQYHSIGYRLDILPASYIRIVIGGIPYFYAQGSFYRPYGSGYIAVAAPLGAVVTTLPAGYIAFSIGLNTYYFANDVYYVWDEPKDAFVVVPKPDGAEQAMEKATQGRLYAYPKAGQSEEQQAKDRYECHMWAVSQSGVNPTLEDQEYTDRQEQNYKRAIAACLEGRDYSVR